MVVWKLWLWLSFVKRCNYQCIGIYLNGFIYSFFMFDLVMYYSLMKSINEVMLYGIQVKDDIFEFMIVSDICFIDDLV